MNSKGLKIPVSAVRFRPWAPKTAGNGGVAPSTSSAETALVAPGRYRIGTVPEPASGGRVPAWVLEAEANLLACLAGVEP